MATQTLPKRHTRKHAPPSRRETKRGRPNKKRNFFLRFWWLWAIPLGIGLIGFGALLYVYNRLPLNLTIEQDQTTYLYNLDGRPMATFDAGVDRTEISFQAMPEVLREAVIAAEDEDFYEHSGVDFMAIIRAAWANFTGGRIEQGASTITQQYARNVFPEVGTEVTVARKIKEILLAIKLERALPKDEILRRYLNTVYFGQGAYGVEAAAKTYFDEHARDLDLAQSALLAGLISGPELYDPVDNPKAAANRRRFVLERMVLLGYITESEAAAVDAQPIDIEEHDEGYERSPSAYFIDWTRRQLENKYGGKTFTGGLRVTASLDPEWQAAAKAAVQQNLSLEPGTPQAALVAIDVDTGEVRAMVGGKSFAKDQVNLATGDGGTGRQSGSSFKAFTLIAAIEQGISLDSVFNGPGTIDLSDKGCPGWKPSNYSDSGAGTMDLVSATANSVNTIFAQLVVEVGPEKVAEIAHRMGIRSPLFVGEGETRSVPCSITLGTLEVTPLEMAEAFSTFASGGVRHTATPFHVVEGPDGEVILDTDRKGKRVLDENDALQAVYAMKQVVASGTGTVADDGLNYEVFGKTGTTDDDSDVWFCGGSSETVACVWVGHPEGRVPMYGATGGTVAAPIWNDFMLGINKYLPQRPGPFETPDLTGEILKGSPVPAPSPVEQEKGKDEEEEGGPAPKPTPKPTAPPPSPPPPPPPTTPPPTTPPPTSPPPSP